MNVKLFGSFLAHHASDLNTLSNVLGSILDVLPVNRQDRDRIGHAIEKVTTSAHNVLDSLDTLAAHADASGAPTTTEASKAAITKAVAEALPGALETALADHFAKHPVSAPAPVAAQIAPGTPGPVSSLAGEAATGTPGKVSGSDQQPQGDGGDRMQA